MVLAFGLLAGCGGYGMKPGETSAAPADPRTTAALERIAGKRVYFGHMSVGFNIVEGLREVAESAAPGQLRIVESRAPAALAEPVFAHGRNGSNHDPASKIAAFVESMDAGLGRSADVAFFKFCFVDVTAQTDVAALFTAYRAATEDLRRRYPRLVIVHVTVPLTTVQRGWKALVKKALGRAPDHYLDNLRRCEYSALVRAAYAGREPVFDLAEVESTWPTGAVEEHSFGGSRFRAMVPGYTKDRGHFNAAGRRRVALALIAVLSSL